VLGWLNGYVRETRDQIEKEKAKPGITAYWPKSVENPHLDEFLPFIEQDEPIEPFKSKHKRKLFYIDIDDTGFYVKKFSYRYSTRLFAPIRGLVLFPSVARRLFAKMLFLNKIGIRTVQPVAVLERRYRGLKVESLLVTEELKAPHLNDYLSEVESPEVVREVVENLVKTVSLMHNNRVHHGDLKNFDNFMVEPETAEIYLLDLDERKTKWLPWWRGHDRKVLYRTLNKRLKNYGFEKADKVLGTLFDKYFS